MTLTDLTLVNFRCHQRLTLKFKDGVTGIVGDNGSGKTSVIEAIHFLLTGELFYGTKQEAIKLGHDTGMVSGSFIVNGKIASLERHLDMSKVLLVYDKVTYKKANDVKELWDKLLQISSEIISRVMIARQGDISLLFSGDVAVREKIFQKIFMVPNTEKLRNLIYKNYIKQCPFIIPIEDLTQLNDSKVLLEKTIKNLTEEFNNIELFTDDEINQYRDRLKYLDNCIEDAPKIEHFEQILTRYRAEEVESLKAIRELDELIDSVDIVEYKDIYNKLCQQASIHKQYKKIELNLSMLKAPFEETYIQEISPVIDELQDKRHALFFERKNIQFELEKKDKQIIKYSDFEGQNICESCGQPIEFIGELLKNLKQEKKDLENRFLTCEQSINNISLELTPLIIKSAEYEKYVVIKNELEKTKQFLYSSITDFDEDELNSYNELITTYHTYENERHTLKLKFERIGSQVNMTKQQLVSFARYDGMDTSSRLEREELLLCLNTQVETMRIYQQKQVELRVKEIELNGLISRISTNIENKEKNDRRNKYFRVLNQIYDCFHTFNFPRKLILDYAGVVTDYLQDNLSNFNIPYKARVADNFHIDMLDSEGRILPIVSGGQQIQIGLSLHVALHELFSQSFPLLIIDEGTTHLDVNNRKAYFDMVKSLKNKKKLKQIIIVDHDPALIDVVDETIELESIIT